MNNKLVKKLFLTLLLFVTGSTFFVPNNFAKAACSPKITGVASAPATVSKEKPSSVFKVTLTGLTGCDATTSKGIKIYTSVAGVSGKLTDVNLSDFASKFKDKDQYVIEKSFNVVTSSLVKDFKTFKINPGIIINGKDSLDSGHSASVTNSAGTKAAPAVIANNQNVSTEEKIDETGQSGFVICGNTVDTPCNVSHLFRGFIIIINYLITMAGFVAVFFIVIAGVQMTASQGQEMHKQAIQKLTGAIIGLVLVALAFVLINSLLSGSLNLGIKNGGMILTNPKKYINQGESPAENDATSGALDGQAGVSGGISGPLK